MLPIHTILHPTDFSKQSAFAFQLACSLAREYGAELFILHVVPPPGFVYAGGVYPVDLVDEQEARRQQLKQLHCPHVNVRTVHRLVEGEPVDQILHLARETQCDLIVMGTHGYSGLSRLVMGSVAEGVMRKAPCPVLTVKNPLPEAFSETAPAKEEAGKELVHA